ncbi:MAG: hypothetical protein IOC80_13125 [Rhodobacter sp.]|nr:hypothetical protein [Rhodobacter sp.]MCA3526602.1 hypothetical protein [Rhodobacter sp.]MCA3529896.1 hypothetical protein [Rhodobacter sp.]MCA3538696.1 hypothetical protein [Rhodobacter sp.]MCA3539644.1 hypothetical protein [Rhodobacter sp.]
MGRWYKLYSSGSAKGWGNCGAYCAPPQQRGRPAAETLSETDTRRLAELLKQ